MGINVRRRAPPGSVRSPSARDDPDRGRRFHRVVTQRVGALDDEYMARGRPFGQVREVDPYNAEHYAHHWFSKSLGSARH